MQTQDQGRAHRGGLQARTRACVLTMHPMMIDCAMSDFRRPPSRVCEFCRRRGRRPFVSKSLEGGTGRTSVRLVTLLACGTYLLVARLAGGVIHNKCVSLPFPYLNLLFACVPTTIHTSPRLSYAPPSRASGRGVTRYSLEYCPTKKHLFPPPSFR